MEQVQLSQEQRVLVEAHWPLVRRAARVEQRRLVTASTDELVSWGSWGLVKAALRWDPDRAPFEVFAWPWVRGAMVDEYRACRRAVPMTIEPWMSASVELGFERVEEARDAARVVAGLGLVGQEARVAVLLGSGLSKKETAAVEGVDPSRVSQVVRSIRLRAGVVEDREDRSCDLCGGLFTPRQVNQRWCSKRCHDRAIRRRATRRRAA